MSALQFLDKVARGEKVALGKRVAIVGGGFTAVDAARAARRLGADEVYILYRRTRQEMPATSEEVDEAEAEGVQVMYLVSPKEVLASGGKVAGIRMANHVLAERDTSGRRRPKEVEGTEFTLKVDTVVSAISQKVGQDSRELGIRLAKDAIATEKDGVTTNVEGVFAAGDAATGPDSIIAAVASGYNAAVAADRAIAGAEAFLEPYPELTPADKELVIARNPKLVKRNRVAPKLRPAAERARDFQVIQDGMTEAEAIAEASRCLRCGCSVTCGLCERICSSFAVSLDDGTQQERIDRKKCHACGMCAQLCPNRNIEIVAETGNTDSHGQQRDKHG
jgi:formate dehydrogenase major subunit